MGIRENYVLATNPFTDFMSIKHIKRLCEVYLSFLEMWLG